MVIIQSQRIVSTGSGSVLASVQLIQDITYYHAFKISLRSKKPRFKKRDSSFVLAAKMSPAQLAYNVPPEPRDSVQFTTVSYSYPNGASYLSWHPIGHVDSSPGPDDIVVAQSQ